MPVKKKKSPGNSPGKIPAPMTAGGDSEDWVKGKANHKRIHWQLLLGATT